MVGYAGRHGHQIVATITSSGSPIAIANPATTRALMVSPAQMSNVGS